MSTNTMPTASYRLVALSQSGDKARYNAADGSKYGGLYGEVYLSVAALVMQYGGIPTAIELPVPVLGVGASVVDADGLRVAFSAHIADLTERVALGEVRQRDVMRLAGEKALSSMLAGKPASVRKAAPKPAKVTPQVAASAPKPATTVPASRGGRRPVAMAADVTPIPSAKTVAMVDAGTEARFAALESGLSMLTGQLSQLVNALTPAAAPAGRITGRKGR